MLQKAFAPMGKDLREVFAQHINLDDPKLKEKYEKRNKQKVLDYTEENSRNKAAIVWEHSLWSSAPIKFTFADWNPSERHNTNKAKELGNKAFTLAKGIQTKAFNVVMSGDAGVGKTSLALAMLYQLKGAGKRVMFVSTSELMHLVSEQYRYQDRAKELEDVKRAMCECDVLLLDDFGAEGGSIKKINSGDFTGVRRDMQSLIYDVANARYEGTWREQKAAVKAGKKLPKPVRSTIVTTNNQTGELELIYDKRTVSRLISKNPEHRLAFNDMEDMRPKEEL